MSYYNDDGYRIETKHHFDDDEQDFLPHFQISFKNTDTKIS